MTLQQKNTLIWVLRGILAFMFLFSGVAKLYPSPHFALTTFEVKQLYPMGFSPSSAAYFSRILIGCEFALGIGLLQPHYLKKLVFSLSIAILSIFCFQLIYEMATTGNSGNCGCFGSLMPMTPLQAVIKNVIGIGMLVWLYRLMKDFDEKKNFAVITSIAFAGILGVFLVGPLTKITSTEVPQEEVVVEEVVPEIKDSLVKKDATVVADNKQIVKQVDKTTTPEAVKPAKVEEPKPKKSGFNSIYSDIDEGRKILCFFAPGCDHCKETIRELTAMKKADPNFPEIKIAFMDEEAELIPAFFEQAGQKYTYKILDIASFWTKLGSGRDTPGVFYYWNGNLIKEYNGINEKAFKKDEFKKIVQKTWPELK